MCLPLKAMTEYRHSYMKVASQISHLAVELDTQGPDIDHNVHNLVSTVPLLDKLIQQAGSILLACLMGLTAQK